MKKDFTSINVVLDASGSMGRLVDDTIGGFNNFLKDQQALAGEATLSLCLFNDDYKLIYDYVPITLAQPLDKKVYRASGGTALLDALGITIDNVGKKLSEMKEKDRPSKVIFLVITDGQENSSHLLGESEASLPKFVQGQHNIYKWIEKDNEIFYKRKLRYPLSRIKDMITHQQQKYNWEFLYYGANVNSIAEAKTLGIVAARSQSYSATSVGTKDLYNSISNTVLDYRTGKK